MHPQKNVGLLTSQMSGWISFQSSPRTVFISTVINKENMAALSAPEHRKPEGNVSWICSVILCCVRHPRLYMYIQRRGTWSTKTLGAESERAFLQSVCKERCLCPARLAGPLLHPARLCLLGYYTFTTQSAPSKRSCSNPRKSRLHWRKWLCSVHKCWPCVLTRVLEALRQGALYPQAASQVTGSGSQLGRLCSGRGRR